ncbi:MAG: alpha/beta hydrolase [Trueperaceae bacterium]|nr:alpha/beta hydrolase [Trueperaceae bacterium]
MVRARAKAFACILAAFFATWVVAQTPIEEGFVSVGDDVRLFYVKYGSGAPDLIVSNHLYAARPLATLAEGRTVVFYDTRGRGFSTPIHDAALLGMEHEIADFGRVQDHFGVERVSVLGWSLWGAFAQRYAVRNPDRVASVIALSPIEPAAEPFGAMEMLSPGPDFDAVEAYLASTAEDIDPFDLCVGIADIINASQVADDSVLDVLNAKACALPNEYDANIEFTLGTIFGSMGDWDWLEEFRAIDVPLLIVHGDQDTIVPEGIAANAEAAQNARVVEVAQAGHMGFIERPAAYADAIDAFLDELP